MDVLQIDATLLGLSMADWGEEIDKNVEFHTICIPSSIAEW